MRRGALQNGSELRVDDSECVVGSSTATVQEQQPSALKILDGKDLLRESLSEQKLASEGMALRKAFSAAARWQPSSRSKGSKAGQR